MTRTRDTYELEADDLKDLGGTVAFERWSPGYRLLVIEGGVLRRLMGERRANLVLSRAEVRRLIRQMQRLIE